VSGGPSTQPALSFELRLPGHSLAPALARACVDGLAGVCAPERLAAARLIVSELVTNAVIHASKGLPQSVVVELSAGEAGIAGVVRDGGPPFEARAELPDRGSIGGFGLHIVDRTATEWGITHQVGNAVWFKV
jgi:anti-sigma regulatory factor (Ser/Thr protein kinase)